MGVYTREEAFKVGRVLQDLDYVCYEDPIPTDDIDGLVQLNQALDIPIHIGEFIFSPYNYAEYIRRGAMDVVRFIVDNVGGITGGMKIARLAEIVRHGVRAAQLGRGVRPRRPLPLRTGDAQQCLVRDDGAAGIERPAVREGQVPRRQGRLRVRFGEARSWAWNSTAAVLDRMTTRIDR